MRIAGELFALATPPTYEDEKEYVALQAADNLAYECRRLLITEEYDTHIPERKAMTRLKERIYKIYKLNYDGLKMIMENQSSDTIPVTPEVENELPLLTSRANAEGVVVAPTYALLAVTQTAYADATGLNRCGVDYGEMMELRVVFCESSVVHSILQRHERQH